MVKPHKLHARTTILIIRPSPNPTRTSCHVKATEPCAYFYILDFSLVGIMQWFRTQSKLNLAHMTWDHIFQVIYISFLDSYLVHEMSLRQKQTYAPPQDKARGLNIVNKGVFLVNHQKHRELGVPFGNRHSWLGSHVLPAQPWIWGSTKKLSMTWSCRSCYHAARTWLHWPPGPSNEAYLSSPHLEASPATTFRAYSSPAPIL
jgi:hypothetical protein